MGQLLLPTLGEYPRLTDTGPTGVTNSNINATTHKFAGIFRAPKAGSIASVAFAMSTVATGSTVEVRLETVSTSTGDPSGSLVNAGATTTVVIANADDDTWKTATFGTAGSVAKGDLVAMVIQNSSGTPANQRHARVGSNAGMTNSIGYSAFYGGASWAHNGAAIMSIKYTGDSDYTPAIGCCPFRTSTATGYSDSTNPDERGISFTAPFSFMLTGMRARLSSFTNWEGTMGLFVGSATSPATTKTIYAVQRYDDAGWCEFYFDAPYQVNQGTVYRLVIRVTNTTNLNFYLNAAAVDTTAVFDKQACYTTRDGGSGAFSDTTTSFPMMSALYESIIIPERVTASGF